MPERDSLFQFFREKCGLDEAEGSIVRAMLQAREAAEEGGGDAVVNIAKGEVASHAD
jgi:hypothetical protein